MLPAVLAEMVFQLWGFVSYRLTARNLAVQYTQGIRVLPAPAIRTQVLGCLLSQICLKMLRKMRTALRAAQGIDKQFQVGQAKLVEIFPEHGDNFSIRPGRGGAKKLGVDLVKLSLPAFLRPFITKHGAKGK